MYNEFVYKINSHKGFTLIELLVVIAIIGILSSVVLASLNSARIKARDVKRQVEIKQIQTALELYYSENGNYPIQSWTSSNNINAWDGFSTTLGMKLPIDPSNTLTGTTHAYDPGNYTYSYFGSGYGCPGQWYMLVYRLEGNASPSSPGARSCTVTFNYSGTMTVGANAAVL